VSDDEQEVFSDGDYDSEDERGFDDDDGMYKVDEDETMKKHTLIGEGAPGSSKAPAAAHQVPLEEALSAAKKSMNRKDEGEQGGSAAASSSSASSSGDAAGRQQDGASSSKNLEQALSKNGGQADTHIWSQDKTSVGHTPRPHHRDTGHLLPKLLHSPTPFLSRDWLCPA
jgi:hypothetical protein